ncbi:MAG: 50S ribosomal protein L22 [Lachnospirales bacterium]
MSRGHRAQIKRKRNEENKDRRPQSHVKFVRLSDTKARIVLEEIKGKDVGTAISLLSYSPRYASKVALKCLNSAIANADHNLGLDVTKLYVQEVFANQGPTLKRIRPRAKGSASRINKKTCHMSIILNER